MSPTPSASVEATTPFTPASWREQTPKARLARLNLLLPESTKHHKQSHESNSLLQEALHSALPCIPYLHERRVAIPQGELATSYHPGEEVVLNGAVDALARAVVPLTAGCVVRVALSESDLPEEFRGILRTCEGVLDERIEESGMDGDIVRMDERVALPIDETADLSSISELLDHVKMHGSGAALYVHAGIFEAVKELLDSLKVNGKKGNSATKVAGLDDAIEVVSKLCYDTVCLYGDTSSMEHVVEGLTAPRVAANISLTRMALITDGASVLQYVRPQRVLRPLGNLLMLLKHYLVGRFDNSAQIAREKSTGGQRTAHAIHINDVLDGKIEGSPRDGVFHILEETYKYAPGERNLQIAPLILRFEEIDGAIALSAMKPPEGVDKTALRNDNSCLWFGEGELTVSPSFPERQVYRFDAGKMEFMLDVEVQISEMARFQLSETLARGRLVVSEKLWIGDTLSAGFYEDPFVYDACRLHEESCVSVFELSPPSNTSSLASEKHSSSCQSTPTGRLILSASTQPGRWAP